MSQDKDENLPQKIAESTRGRPFAEGNPGRPRGSKNKATAVAQALIAGEEEGLVRKAIELAKAGDAQMLKFFLDRLLPKERLIKIDLPRLDYADDVIDGMAAITSSIAEGQITPSEGAALSSMLARYSRTLEIAELSKRIDALEAGLNPEE